MPLVTLTLRRGKDAAFKSAVLNAVHGALVAAGVNVDLGTKLVRVDSDLDQFLLSQALVDAGYDPVPVGLKLPDHI